MSQMAFTLLHTGSTPCALQDMYTKVVWTDELSSLAVTLT